MKISDFIPQIKTNNKIQKARAGARPDLAATQAVGTDKVEISAGSLDVQRMKGIIQNTPDVRMDRVQALKEQIERGDYEVDPYRVADKMLISLLSDSGVVSAP
jgi:negative regulator of flagellin synthesis FlgM